MPIIRDPDQLAYATEFTHMLSKEAKKKKDEGLATSVALPTVLGTAGATLATKGVNNIRKTNAVRGEFKRLGQEAQVPGLTAEQIIQQIDDYAVAAQKGLKIPIGTVGPNAGKVGTWHPISLMYPTPNNAKIFIDKVLGKEETGPQAARLNDLRAHYPRVQHEPRRTMLNEVFYDKADPVNASMKLAPDVSHDIPKHEIEAIISESEHVPLMKRLQPFLRRVHEAKTPQEYESLMAPFIRRHGVLIKGNEKGPAAVKAYQAALAAGMLTHIPAVAAGTAVAGLAGKKILDRLTHKESSVSDEKKRDLEAAGSLAAAGGAGLYASHKLDEASKSKPSKLITVGGGQMDKPVTSVNIGAGHVTPANAIYEELKKHPAVKRGEFVVDTLHRKSLPGDVTSKPGNPVKNIIKRLFGMGEDVDALMEEHRPTHVGEHGLRHSAVHVNTGFGNVDDLGARLAFGHTYHTVNPKGNVLFWPDETENVDRIRTGVFGGTSAPSIVTFGKHNPETAPFKHLAHYSHHPALSPSYLAIAEALHKDPTATKESILTELADRLKIAHPEEAAKLHEAVKSGKKIITITGSSRGDYTPQRAKELYKLLKEQGREGEFAIIAAHGNQYIPATLKYLEDSPGVINLPHTGQIGGRGGQDWMARLLHATDYHAASTGASAAAEAGVHAAPAFYALNPNQWMEKERKGLKKTGLWRPEAEAVHRAINLNEWNATQIKNIAEEGKQGYTTAKQLLKLIDSAAPRGNTDAMAQLTRHQAAAIELANRIVDHAKEVNLNSKQVRRALQLRGYGGALASEGLGGYGLYKALKKD